MWATSTFLPDAIWLIGALGATYVSHVVWVKAEIHEAVELAGCVGLGLEPTKRGDLDVIEVIQPQAPGLGQHFRHLHEHLLYAKIGEPGAPPAQHRLPSVIFAPRREHSRKPDEAYELIEKHDAFLGGRRLSMFAREVRYGWEGWGAEYDDLVINNVMDAKL
jgi:hypothetical protein